MAAQFNGDGRTAALAFQRVYNVVSKYGDEEAKNITCDVVAAMGPGFRGNVERACDAFERVMAMVVIAKSGKAVTGRLESTSRRYRIPEEGG